MSSGSESIEEIPDRPDRFFGLQEECGSDDFDDDYEDILFDNQNDYFDHFDFDEDNQDDIHRYSLDTLKVSHEASALLLSLSFTEWIPFFTGCDELTKSSRMRRYLAQICISQSESFLLSRNYRPALIHAVAGFKLIDEYTPSAIDDPDNERQSILLRSVMIQCVSIYQLGDNLLAGIRRDMAGMLATSLAEQETSKREFDPEAPPIPEFVSPELKKSFLGTCEVLNFIPAFKTVVKGHGLGGANYSGRFGKYAPEDDDEDEDYDEEFDDEDMHAEFAQFMQTMMMASKQQSTGNNSKQPAVVRKNEPMVNKTRGGAKIEEIVDQEEEWEDDKELSEEDEIAGDEFAASKGRQMGNRLMDKYFGVGEHAGVSKKLTSVKLKPRRKL